MATLREWLTEQNFDWKNGRIIYHRTEEPRWPGWAEPVERTEIDATHPILDREFSTAFGAPMCPRVVAFDANRVYFPGQYDGNTWLNAIELRPEAYLEPGSDTPYPGG